MPSYKTNAIVLRTYPLGEHDRIVVLLSPDKGKLRCVAKGVRKTSSSLAGKMELFNHLTLLISNGRNLDTISQAGILESFRSVRSDLNQTAHALYILELVDKAVLEPEPHSELFELLRSSLALLPIVNSLSLLTRAFELKLITLLGYTPQTQACVNCSNPPVKVQRFSAKLGGILCHHCFKQDPDAMSISPQGINLIETVISLPLEEINNVDVRAGIVNSITPIIRQCIIDKFGKDLQSRRFLEDLIPSCKN